MVHEVGNIELGDLLETEPKAQCKDQKFIKYTMDFLSIPDYVIKIGRLHGHRYGKKLGHWEYYIANQLRRSARRSSSTVSMTVFRDEQIRNRMIENG